MIKKIFINENAEDINSIFINKKIKIEKLLKETEENIYKIKYENKELKLVLKLFYQDIKLECYNNEIKALNKLNGIKGIPKLYSYGKNLKCKFILIERMKGEDLFDYHKKHGIFSENKIKDIFKKLLIILSKIHSRNILHLDIKPENIIYDEISGQVSIIDFEKRRTESYCPPEHFSKTEFKNEFKTDVWSLAVTIYSLMSGSPPFYEKNSTLKHSIQNDTPIFSNSIFSNSLKDLLEKMLDKNPNTRYNITDCLNHSYFF